MHDHDRFSAPSSIRRRRTLGGLVLTTGLLVGAAALPSRGRTELTLTAPRVEATEATSGPPGLSVRASSEGHRGWEAHAEATLTDVPAEIERRLHRYLEEYRAAEDAPWLTASVASAMPLYRPGDADPSYWEFQLRARNGTAQGFVLVATADHDFPVPLASAHGEAPTTTLKARAEAMGHTIRRAYLPVVGFPVVETVEGAVLLGEAGLPVRLQGYDEAWIDEPAESFAGANGTPPKIATDLKASSWASWDALKAEYVDAYAIPNALLARSAAPAWAIEREVAEVSEALSLGDVRHVPLLLRGEDVQFSVSGDGAELVEVSKVTRGAGEPALRIAVGNPTTPGFSPVAIGVYYGDGTSETLQFDVGPLPPPSALSRDFGLLAAPGLGSGNVAAAASMVAPAVCSGDTVFVRPVDDTDNPRLDVFYPEDGKMHRHQRRADDAAITRLPAVGIDSRPGGVAVRDKSGQFWKVSGSSITKVNASADATVFTQVAIKSEKIAPLGYPVQRLQLKAPDGRYVNLTTSAAATLVSAPTSMYALCYDKTSVSYWAGKNADDAWKRTPSYDQIPAKVKPNVGACQSGCGATAWAMIMGWADGVAHDDTAQGHTIWREDKNLVAGTAPTRPPGGRNAVIDDLTWEINRANDTFAMTGCVKTLDPLGGNTQYWTAPHVMAQVNNYIKKRTTVSVSADYDGAGIGTAEGAMKARDVIRQRKRPVIIGEGHLVHYSVAFGYRKYTYFTWESSKWNKRIDRERYESSRGWGHDYSHQVPYHTWFAGWLHPNTGGWDKHDALASGGSCETHLVCATNRCDRGFNSTGTSKCIPHDGKGVKDEFCTHNNHCKTGVCSKPSASSKTGKCTGKVGLGETCKSSGECTSTRCDVGFNSTGSSKCIPHDGTGVSGAFCTHNHHCKTGVCSGLTATKKSGTCAAKQALEGKCLTNEQCTSGRCDAGFNSTGTSTCIPHNGAGNKGDYCTHPHHCKAPYTCKRRVASKVPGDCG
jgi:hypothetical protein